LDGAGGLLLDGIGAPDDSAFFKRTMERFAREIAQKESVSAPGAVLDPGNEAGPVAQIEIFRTAH